MSVSLDISASTLDPHCCRCSMITFSYQIPIHLQAELAGHLVYPLRPTVIVSGDTATVLLPATGYIVKLSTMYSSLIKFLINTAYESCSRKNRQGRQPDRQDLFHSCTVRQNINKLLFSRCKICPQMVTR